MCVIKALPAAQFDDREAGNSGDEQKFALSRNNNPSKFDGMKRTKLSGTTAFFVALMVENTLSAHTGAPTAPAELPIRTNSSMLLAK